MEWILNLKETPAEFRYRFLDPLLQSRQIIKIEMFYLFYYYEMLRDEQSITEFYLLSSRSEQVPF